VPKARIAIPFKALADSVDLKNVADYLKDALVNQMEEKAKTTIA
jgi:hypothetical protein